MAACTIEMGLDPSHQLSEGDIHDYELPDEIGDNWRDLARAFGYKEAQIKSIEKEKRNSNKECCIEILVRWLYVKGKDATAGKLAEVLAKIKLQSLAEKLVKPNDQSQFEKTLALLREDFEKTLALLREDFEKKLALLREDGSKMRATIKELEEKDSKLQERIKDELEDASEQGQKDLENAVQLFDTQNASVVSMDTDLDQAARERLTNLTKELNTYVTPQLEVREVNQDQLKMTVKLDLLRRLSENLQKIYSDVVAMASETCKCNEDVKRDFYDFAYHGLQAQHNELVHRVEDLKSAQHGMSEEEKKNLVQLRSYQANRQRQVERLDKLWRGLFSPPEYIPKSPCSDTTGVSDKSKESKKVSRHTDPGARPKSRKVRAKGKAPADCDDDENEVPCNFFFGNSEYGDDLHNIACCMACRNNYKSTESSAIFMCKQMPQHLAVECSVQLRKQ